MRYSLQELNHSGFTYYEIIDTANKCRTVYSTKSYTEALNMVRELEAQN